MGKQQWYEPKITEIEVKMTEEEPVKSSGTGDSDYPTIPLNDWHECVCCS